jgi:hypothetical protein
MTALPPDPDPEATPNVEGSVPPGETPPDSAQTSATSNPDPPARGRFTPTGVATIIGIALFLALFVATAMFLILRIWGVSG